jgi:hypothetical protein
MAAAQPPVDWHLVDSELARVPDDFKDPKFYALKHVVEILSSSDPQGLVGEVCCVCVERERARGSEMARSV